MRGRLAVLIAAALLTLLPVNSPGVSEAAKRCTVADLNGTYVFAATGFGTPPGGSSPTAPKAIIEVISFNGDGTVDTPKVTLNFNGRGPKLRYLLRPLGRLGNLADPDGQGQRLPGDGDEKSALTSDLLTSRRRPAVGSSLERTACRRVAVIG
jgi:hypothetical protein